MARALNLRQIEAFKAIIEAGTVSRAADLLRISQPAASKLLAHLEAETGLRLFDRTQGRLTATDAGRRLYAEVDRIFAGVHQIERAVASIRRETEQRLVVGLMPGMSGGFIRRVISAVLADRPGVHVSMITRNSQILMDWVATRQLDIGLIGIRSDDPLLNCEAVLSHPMMCILPPDHRLARQSSITTADLADEPFIGFDESSQTHRCVAGAFAQAGFTPHIVLDATTAAVVNEFVAAGMGVTVMHPLLAEPVRARVVARPFLPETRYEFVICRGQTSRRSPLIDAFVDHFRAESARFLHGIADGTGWAVP